MFTTAHELKQLHRIKRNICLYTISLYVAHKKCKRHNDKFLQNALPRSFHIKKMWILLPRASATAVRWEFLIDMSKSCIAKMTAKKSETHMIIYICLHLYCMSYEKHVYMYIHMYLHIYTSCIRICICIYTHTHSFSPSSCLKCMPRSIALELFKETWDLRETVQKKGRCWVKKIQLLWFQFWNPNFATQKTKITSFENTKFCRILKICSFNLTLSWSDCIFCNQCCISVLHLLLP